MAGPEAKATRIANALIGPSGRTDQRVRDRNTRTLGASGTEGNDPGNQAVDQPP